MRAVAATLLALALIAPTQAAGLTVAATPESVAWSGAAGACVYWVDPTGARYRLGCAHESPFTVEDGLLYPGDVVEVRAPRPDGRGRLTGRAAVEAP